MVNAKSETKQKILTQLKESPSWISGEDISLKIGISRVAVWKQIKSLLEQGYPVESSSRGYRMKSEGDYLTDLEFSNEKDILFFDELNSTMDEAVRQLNRQPEECRSFTILADHQSAGINRIEGQWESPSGGIYLTFVLKKDLPLASIKVIKQKGIYTAMKTLADLKEIKKESLAYTAEGGLFLNNNKIGGLLEEYQVRGTTVLWYALGLGIHLNDSPPAPLSSVQKLCGRKLNRASIIKDIKQLWDQSLKTEDKKILKDLKTFRTL